MGQYCRFGFRLFKNDYDLIGRSPEDVIIEPIRSILIPGFDEIKTKCKEAGHWAAASVATALLFLCCVKKKELHKVLHKL